MSASRENRGGTAKGWSDGRDSKRLCHPTALFLALALVAPSAFGQALDAGDTAWMLVAATLVLCMSVPGVALFYSGMVRSSNVLSVFMQCFAIAVLVSLLWLALGYSLAFGDSWGVVGDLSKVFYAGVEEGSRWGTIPESAYASFQLTFAIFAAVLIVGAFAERARFAAVLSFILLWSVAVYAPVAHWVWGGGWLGRLGLMDFAGGSVVHVPAGISALVVAQLLGPRRGLPHNRQAPHSMVFTMAGAGLLWVGWSAFNGGSAIASNGDAAMAISAAHFAGAAGAGSWMLIEWLRDGKPTALGLVTGLVAGLATVTASAGFIGPAGGFLVGALGGAACFGAIHWLKRQWQLDDSLDVFAVHGVGGALGTVLTALSASSALGIFGGQEDVNVFGRLVVQIVGVATIGLYSGGLSWFLFRLVDHWIGCRVSEDAESEGLDRAADDEAGYRLRSPDAESG